MLLLNNLRRKQSVSDYLNTGNYVGARLLNLNNRFKRRLRFVLGNLIIRNIITHKKLSNPLNIEYHSDNDNGTSLITVRPNIMHYSAVLSKQLI